MFQKHIAYKSQSVRFFKGRFGMTCLLILAMIADYNNLDNSAFFYYNVHVFICTLLISDESHAIVIQESYLNWYSDMRAKNSYLVIHLSVYKFRV